MTDHTTTRSAALHFKAVTMQRNAANRYERARAEPDELTEQGHQLMAADWASGARDAYVEYLAAAAADAMSLHRMTERADGPDLDDLVRLIRYLREHQIAYRFSDTLVHNAILGFNTPNGDRLAIIENDTVVGVHFVGPDGTVYDANREAL